LRARPLLVDPACDARPWQSSPEGALALLILLDQYPRNAFRGTPRMDASDGFARLVADAAIARGHDQRIEPALRLFMYLPFAPSEHLADQERSLLLNQSLGEPNLSHAKRHRTTTSSSASGASPIGTRSSGA
jgi:uncharacterized protein (DUF924 family)